MLQVRADQSIAVNLKLSKQVNLERLKKEARRGRVSSNGLSL